VIAIVTQQTHSVTRYNTSGQLLLLNRPEDETLLTSYIIFAVIVRSHLFSPIIVGVDFISGLCFTQSKSHVQLPVDMSSSHLQLSTVYWVIPKSL